MARLTKIHNFVALLILGIISISAFAFYLGIVGTKSDRVAGVINQWSTYKSQLTRTVRSTYKVSSTNKAISTPSCLGNQRKYDPSQSGGWTNFTLVMPHIEPTIPCRDRDLYIVVVVNSDAAEGVHRSLRMAIRKTWGNSSSTSHDNKWRLFFALGLTANGAANRNNRHEALQYNDVIIGKFMDNYKNIVIKTFMGHFWAFSIFSCKYVLKTDDDVYVRVPRLSHWLSKAGTPRRFYGGFINQAPFVFRNPKSKWYISRQQFKESVWPPFCHGAYHVLSTDLLPAYFNYTQFHKPFHTDDAYIGVAARDLGVTTIQIPGFSLNDIPVHDCDWLSTTAIGHQINPTRMMEIHENYKSLISYYL